MPSQTWPLSPLLAVLIRIEAVAESGLRHRQKAVADHRVLIRIEAVAESGHSTGSIAACASRCAYPH